MFIPDDFEMVDRSAMLDVIQHHPLAMLVTNGEQGPQASQLPLIFETDDTGRDWLCGHFARANPHWKCAQGSVAVAMFRGADGYITPSWYPTKQETGKVVPTWNYVAIEARGPLYLADGMDETGRIVALLTDAMEARRPKPWAMTDAPTSYTASMLRGLVAFRMEVQSLQGAAKLSQNKSEADYGGVCEGLRRDGETPLLDAMSS